jgi:hypothetical protein
MEPGCREYFRLLERSGSGQLLAEIIIPEALRERHYQGIARYLATGEGPILNQRIEVPALCADGTEIFIELSITAIPIDGPPLSRLMRATSRRASKVKPRSRQPRRKPNGLTSPKVSSFRA